MKRDQWTQGAAFALSNYAQISRLDEGVVSVYSTRTGVHAVINRGSFAALASLFERGRADTDSFDAEAFELLRETGILVENPSDELPQLKQERSNALEADYGFRLLILPTLQCNFACPYCFQSGIRRAGSMSAETRLKLVDFVDQGLSRHSQGPLVVQWFGGEPLLQLKIVQELTRSFTALARSHETDYRASLITNGYWLDRLTPDVLQQLELSYIQVTLDGPRKVHDRRRPLQGGRGTFARILANLRQVSEYCSRITVRVNVDRSNYKAFPHLLQLLKREGLAGRCRLSVARVDCATGTCSADRSLTLTGEEWATIERVLSEEVRKAGITRTMWLEYPEPWALFCSAQIKHAFVVDPDGLIYKCPNDAGLRERAIFDLNRRQPLNLARAKQLRDSSPFGRAVCEACQLLPLCNAGCPSVNVDSGWSAAQCTALKYNLEERLAQLAQQSFAGLNRGSG